MYYLSMIYFFLISNLMSKINSYLELKYPHILRKITKGRTAMIIKKVITIEQ